jgi:hypothetical protein
MANTEAGPETEAVSGGGPNRHRGEDAMQIVEALDSTIAALKEMGDSKTPSLARRKEWAETLTEGIAALEKFVNDSEARHEAIFFWVDENEDLITEENENGDAEGYLEIEQQRGDDQFTRITLSPKDVKELRLALEAEAFDRRARERKHARNLKRREPKRANRVKKNAAN